MKKLRAALAICIMAGLLSGCSLLSPFSGNKQSQQSEYSKTSTDEKYQTAAVIRGKTVILNNHIKKNELNRKNKDVPLNGWQKFCRWLGNLSILTVLIICGGLFAGTSAPLVFLLNGYNRFKKAFIQTVRGIDQSGEVKEGSNLANSLSKVQDNDVKALVDDIQQPGKAR